MSHEFYHAGHRTLQDRFDGRRLADALAEHRMLSAFGPEDVTFIESAEFFFLATAHGTAVDCSFKGGAPGFVRVTGPASLEWPEYDGNSMYRSLGNILESPRVGLLFISFGEKPRRLRVNGTCALSAVTGTPGQKLTITLQASEIFPNCPRYIPDLATGDASPFLPGASGYGAKPAWKDAPDLNPALPEDDPHK